MILNPSCSKSNGCGLGTVGTSGRYRRTHTCGLCGAASHNKRYYPTLGADGEPPPDSSLQSQYVRLSNDLGFFQFESQYSDKAMPKWCFVACLFGAVFVSV